MSQTKPKESLAAARARELIEAVHSEMTECICPGCILTTALSATLKASVEYAPLETNDDLLAALAEVNCSAIYNLKTPGEQSLRSLVKLHKLLDLRALMTELKRSLGGKPKP